MITIDFVNEFALKAQTKIEIANLLHAVFPESHPGGQPFFKQLPHHRLLLLDSGKVAGHLGIDYRVMNLNGEVVSVFGIKDLAVLPVHQGKGYGAMLMNEFAAIAEKHSANIDFAFLVTDVPAFYSRFGFVSTHIQTTWLKIHRTKSYNIGNETITDAVFMYKEISGKKWADGELDLLGYMY